MAATDAASDRMTERCERCGDDTPHVVALRLITESTEPENAEYSREPYRVATCQVCGAETTLRMNNV
jgi:ribosomal protein S14